MDYNQLDLFQVLGVTKDTPKSELKRVYRKLVMKYHPDRNVGKSKEEMEQITEEFQKISYAYKVLSDDDLRHRYLTEDLWDIQVDIKSYDDFIKEGAFGEYVNKDEVSKYSEDSVEDLISEIRKGRTK